jgi:hypothetical protein
LTFVGPDGHRLWAYDEQLPNVGEVSQYRSLSTKMASELAGALVGI